MITPVKIGDVVGDLLRDGMPLRFTAYDGSSAGPASRHAFYFAPSTHATPASFCQTPEVIPVN